MSGLVPSVVLAAVSAVCYAAAAILQERVAAAAARQPVPEPLWRSARWWGSVALNGSGSVLHVLALGFGPLSVVQPLGVLTLVFVLPLAALWVGRRAGRTGWRGALLVSAGLAGLLALTAARPAGALSGRDQLTLAVVAPVLFLSLVVAARGTGRPAVRSALRAAAAGVAFGIASVFTKTVAADWTPAALLERAPAIAVTAVLAVAGLLASQASYRDGGLAAPLATVTVVNPVVASAAGIALLGEGFRYGTAGVPFVLAASVVTVYGLVVLTVRQEKAAGGRSPAERGRAAALPPAGAGVPAVAGRVLPVPDVARSGALPERDTPSPGLSPAGT
ncbi:DMT family transporter [Streptomyces sp. F63]|uniref:DMT family transporter n=1 Tax=Streptomyces sp. F63 TaxID=2824887 RepID=UPI001B37F414|nr:DMT family transporter [Streptomyces sp. F63]MBQ0987975.1 DMT family transporter [Streptomyces sp. F63]